MLYPKVFNAHEPLFALGPEIIRKGGYVIESAIEYERLGSGSNTHLDTHIMYGINETLAISVSMPFFLSTEKLDETTGILKKSAGLGKIETNIKYLVYKDYDFGKRDQVVFIGGIRWPTVARDKDPFLENQAVDFLISAAVGREMLYSSYFGTLTYIIKTPSYNQKEGDQIMLTFAAGFRPLPIDYYKLDWVFYVEFDGILTLKETAMGIEDKNSGSIVFFVGPIVFISKKNILLKAGIQAPILEQLNDDHHKHDYRFAVGIDFHF